MKVFDAYRCNRRFALFTTNKQNEYIRWKNNGGVQTSKTNMYMLKNNGSVKLLLIFYLYSYKTSLLPLGVCVCCVLFTIPRADSLMKKAVSCKPFLDLTPVFAFLFIWPVPRRP